jgi:hypothetical protein
MTALTRTLAACAILVCVGAFAAAYGYTVAQDRAIAHGLIERKGHVYRVAPAEVR